ncbi:MAG: 2-hydroxyacid dehydrogenase [Alphaproteobacteria bacterium]|nr:2-hydroxyacid dehydrogenase [Alphaproteobacteria bacterium]
MQKPTLLMTGPYPEWEMPLLKASYHVLKLWEAPDKAAFIAAHAKDVRAIASRGDLGAANTLIDALPHLEIISLFGVGLDAVDLAHCKAKNIRVTITPDVLTADVADIALGLCLAVARNIPQGDAHVRSGAWANAMLPLATRMTGKRMGIIGLGNIGMAIAKRAAAFDMPIAYHNRNKRNDVPYAYCETVEALAAQSDFLVAVIPGGAQTQAMIGAAAFIALGKEGYFINVARGSVVDEAALLHALEKGVIKGAGLDVYLNEPKPDPRFAKLTNVVLQPHIGSGTFETRRGMGQMVRDNLAAHFAGKPLLSSVV